MSTQILVSIAVTLLPMVLIGAINLFVPTVRGICPFEIPSDSQGDTRMILRGKNASSPLLMQGIH